MAAEIEAALIEHEGVAEAAVVGINDELTGQAVNAFVSLKDGVDPGEQTRKDLILQVRKSIGPFAAPKAIFVVDDLLILIPHHAGFGGAETAGGRVHLREDMVEAGRIALRPHRQR